MKQLVPYRGEGGEKKGEEARDFERKFCDTQKRQKKYVVLS